MDRKIVVLGTGGTIAGTAADSSDNVGYVAAQVAVGSLVEGIEAPRGFVLESEQVAQVDSKDMSFEVWRRLALRCTHWLARSEVAGIVVTHGTDTMEETAFFLQALLAPSKPIVLTGAMRPASSASADGPQNLRDAIRVVASPEARGVTVVFAGVVHGAQDVAKAHTYRSDPYTSADTGCIGYVEEARLRLLRPWPARGSAHAQAALKNLVDATSWPRVEIVMNYAGANAATVDALVQSGVQGLVAAGTGNASLHESLEEGLLRAQAAGVRVVRASRCGAGPLLDNPRDRLPHSHGLSPVKARIELLLEILASHTKA